MLRTDVIGGTLQAGDKAGTEYGCFPKSGFLRVPIISNMMSRGVYWRLPIYRNYHKDSGLVGV